MGIDIGVFGAASGAVERMNTRVLLFLILAYFAPELYFRFVHKASWSEYKGEWAVVTGASYGIGRETALKIASEGLNVIITGRTAKKLEGLKKEIEERFKVQCAVFQQDITNPDWTEVEKVLEGRTVSVLFNNVGGLATSNMTLLHFYDDETHKKQRALNFDGCLGWTRAVLPGMYANKRGRIISASSLATVFSYKEGLYGTDKHAIHGLMRTVNNEYSDYGIHAEAQVIGPVSTPALGNPDNDAIGLVVTSAYFAKYSVEKVGFREIYSPTIMHGFLGWLYEKLPITLRVISTKLGTEEAEKHVLNGFRMKLEEKFFA